jgi:uncharacterized protein YjbJ (UPF0337 family)
MDWNRVEGNWKQVKGKVKEKWGQLTDDDLDLIAGKRDQLEGKIQERYGLAKDQVRKGTQRNVGDQNTLPAERLDPGFDASFNPSWVHGAKPGSSICLLW